MPSVLSHPAIPLAVAAGFGRTSAPARLTLVACAASVLPDVDAFGYWAGVPYDAPLGHRGFTHSLFFAVAVAVAVAAFAGRFGVLRRRVLLVVLVASASHGLLDAMTTGGMGVAFFSPFSNARYFLPWRPILVSPIGVSSFFSARGLSVLASEARWVWAPSAAAAALGLAIRRAGALAGQGESE